MIRSRLSTAALASTLLTAAWVSSPALAGECRAQLRPLLLSAEPEAERLAQVHDLCNREAAAGDADAGYQLAFFHLGLAGRWEPEQGIPLIRRAAEAGVPEAQYWLAWQSESGAQLGRDERAALQWYERAAAGRHKLALIRLADAYEKGELGVVPDARKVLALRAQIRRCEEEPAGKKLEGTERPGGI